MYFPLPMACFDVKIVVVDWLVTAIPCTFQSWESIGFAPQGSHSHRRLHHFDAADE
jgi:hypothetical protein